LIDEVAKPVDIDVVLALVMVNLILNKGRLIRVFIHAIHK